MDEQQHENQQRVENKDKQEKQDMKQEEMGDKQEKDVRQETRETKGDAQRLTEKLHGDALLKHGTSNTVACGPLRPEK